MNASISGPAAEPLLFSWELTRRRHVAITAFLALSLIAHALCFYIFQIVYPATVSLLPPPARVSVITSNSEEGRTLLRWIDAEDPALAFTTQRPPEARLRALPKVEHIPSYLAVEPALKQVPPPVVDLRIPSSQPAGAVPFVYRQATPPLSARATSASFSKELDAFGAPTLPDRSFAASNDETPETIRFRVAVSGTGEIRYCFALNSSGDPALDEQARRYLTLCRFSQSSISGEKLDRSLTWGIATVEWGNDVARPRPTPTGTAPIP
jgi:hypothetical protein